MQLPCRGQADYNADYLYFLQSPVRIEHRLALRSGGFEVYVKVQSKRYEERPAIDMRLVADSSLYNYDGIGYTAAADSLIGTVEKSSYYRIMLKDPGGDYAGLQLRVQEGPNDPPYFYTVPLRHPLIFDAPDLTLWQAEENLPNFTPYLHTGETCRIKSSKCKGELTVYYYSQTFLPAVSPMATSADVKKALEHDSVYQVRADTLLSFANPGLYFIQTDSSGLRGLSLRVEEKPFPRMGEPEDLVRPVIYMSTRQERDNLFAARDKKEALDDYWMGVAQTRDQARRIIKSYYRQVTRANLLFTNYKPGWQTDPGMVYIIFGKPDEVYLSLQGEQWVYHRKGYISGITFTFVRVKNIFTPWHLELIRDPDYERRWFGMVSAWRKGLVNIYE